MVWVLFQDQRFWQIDIVQRQEAWRIVNNVLAQCVWFKPPCKKRIWLVKIEWITLVSSTRSTLYTRRTVVDTMNSGQVVDKILVTKVTGYSSLSALMQISYPKFASRLWGINPVYPSDQASDLQCRLKYFGLCARKTWYFQALNFSGLSCQLVIGS